MSEAGRIVVAKDDFLDHVGCGRLEIKKNLRSCSQRKEIGDDAGRSDDERLPGFRQGVERSAALIRWTGSPGSSRPLTTAIPRSIFDYSNIF